MKVLIASAECSPFAKVGGLADAISGIASSLRAGGVDAMVVIPFYPWIQSGFSAERVGALDGLRNGGEVWQARCEETGNQIWMVDPGSLFNRPGGAYADPSGADWPDSDQRFWSFSEAVVEIAADRAGLNWRADVVHVNDWHTAPVSLIMKEAGSDIPTVLSVHNHSFQGLFEETSQTYLKPHDICAKHYRLHDRFSFLRAGVVSANEITTVSHSYRRDLLRTPDGFGLEGDFGERCDQLSAIPNGIDTESWNPATDPVLKSRFCAEDLSGKGACKGDLKAGLGLPVDPGAPLIVVVSRLTVQKMSDRLPELALAHWVDSPLSQFVILGRGDREIEERLKAFAEKHSSSFIFLNDYSDQMARRMLGGADLLLHPSRFEPCGLVPIYAMRYGAVPIVTPTGGLHDLLNTSETQAGFMTASLGEDDVLQTMVSAVHTFQQGEGWARVVQAAMSVLRDWSDTVPAYLDVYGRAMGRHQAEVCTEHTVNLS